MQHLCSFGLERDLCFIIFIIISVHNFSFIFFYYFHCNLFINFSSLPCIFSITSLIFLVSANQTSTLTCCVVSSVKIRKNMQMKCEEGRIKMEGKVRKEKKCPDKIQDWIFLNEKKNEEWNVRMLMRGHRFLAALQIGSICLDFVYCLFWWWLWRYFDWTLKSTSSFLLDSLFRVVLRGEQVPL